MNIVFVSTWKQECGIAEYTEALATEMKGKGHNVHILTEAGVLDRGGTIDGEIPYSAVWYRMNLKGILTSIQSSKVKPDVVHIQHEYGIFPDTLALKTIIHELGQLSISVFVTLHTVLREKYNFTMNLPCGTIVHSLGASVYVPWAHVIPHWIRPTDIDPLAKQKLKLKDRPLLLVPGFINEGKAQYEIIEKFAQSSLADKCQLAVVGTCRDTNYLNRIYGLVTRIGNSNIIISPVYESKERRHLWFSAADGVILGAEKETPYSSSGQLHTAVGYRMPILAKQSEIFRSPPGCAVLYTWSDFMTKLQNFRLTNMTTYQDFAIDQQNLDRIANKHLEIYAH